MATIEKRGDKYRITVNNGTDINGKRIRERTTFEPDPNMTKRQQERALQIFAAKFEESVKNGTYTTGDKITFQTFAERWLREYAINQLARPTYEDYEDCLRLYVFPAIGHLKLGTIKPPHLISFYNNLMEDGVRLDGKHGGYGYSTIRKCHAVISSILSTAVSWMMIESNPCQKTKLPKRVIETTQEEVVKHFTLEQVVIFLDALEKEYPTTYKAHKRIDDTGKPYTVPEYTAYRPLPEKYKIFFKLALFGGFRRGELIALKWEDIDFSENTIKIIKSVAQVRGGTITKRPKNEKSKTVSMPESIMKELKKYKIKQNQEILSLGDQWVGEGNVFTQEDGKRMYPSTPTNTFRKLIRNYNTITEDPTLQLPEITLHGLRHTMATILIAIDPNFKAVASRLGHSDPMVTLRIYAHAVKSTDERIANTLEHIINQASEK